MALCDDTWYNETQHDTQHKILSATTLKSGTKHDIQNSNKHNIQNNTKHENCWV